MCGETAVAIALWHSKTGEKYGASNFRLARRTHFSSRHLGDPKHCAKQCYYGQKNALDSSHPVIAGAWPADMVAGGPQGSKVIQADDNATLLIQYPPSRPQLLDYRLHYEATSKQ